MTSRPLPVLLPLALLTTTACFAAPAASAQTLPTITAALSGSGTTNFKSGPIDFRNYTFNITGFSGVVSDPTDYYTIYSLKNSSIENSPNFFGLAPYSLPDGWTFTDPTDFIISTGTRGIHAVDPIFGLTIFQTAGTPAIDPTGAPFTFFHQANGVDPFLNSDGAPVTVLVNAVPEASPLVSFGLLLLGSLALFTRGLHRSCRAEFTQGLDRQRV